MSLHNFVWNSMQIPKLSFFLALIVFEFYSFEINKKNKNMKIVIFSKNISKIKKILENEKI